MFVRLTQFSSFAVLGLVLAFSNFTKKTIIIFSSNSILDKYFIRPDQITF